MIDFTLLQTEISTDPLGRGYAGMSDTEVADALNTADISGQKPVPHRDILTWLIETDKLTDIVGLKTSTNRQLKSIGITLDALVLTDLTASADFTKEFVDDLGNPTGVRILTTLLNALITAGILTANHKTAFLALANTLISRGEALFGAGVTVTHTDVAIARGRV